jgi:tRNA pseudouridine32 synthase / 23S rRNA pseudouridine746 synthase
MFPARLLSFRDNFMSITPGTAWASAELSLVPIYADSHLAAFNKPTGLLAVPGRGTDKQHCLASIARGQFDDALVVHRLDQATSGIMLFARGQRMQSALGKMFEQRQIYKRYVAVIEGQLRMPQVAEQKLDDDSDDWALIDLPLVADWPNRPRQQVCHERGKPSHTRYRVLAYDAASNTTRVELVPITGRSHQLRVHLQAIGHPICGDALYGDAATQPRLMLHASELSFCHPATQCTMALLSEPGF